MKFCLLHSRVRFAISRFSFFLTDVAQLTEPERSFTLSPSQIAANQSEHQDRARFPFARRCRADRQDLRAGPVLIEESRGPAGNPWGITFSRMFDMSNDSGLFRSAAQLRDEGFERNGVVGYNVDYLARARH